MRQAIEEGFILDVLRNYTSYKLASELARFGEPQGASRGPASEPEASASPLTTDSEVERSAAVKGLMNWVRLHPYNIAQKVQIVVEHFRETVCVPRNGPCNARQI
jgi:type I restriction enzyme R subunit